MKEVFKWYKISVISKSRDVVYNLMTTDNTTV